MTGHQWRHDVSQDGTEVEAICVRCGAWSDDRMALVDYWSGDDIGPASCDDRARSLAAAHSDGGYGLIQVDGRTVWVRS